MYIATKAIDGFKPEIIGVFDSVDEFKKLVGVDIDNVGFHEWLRLTAPWQNKIRYRLTHYNLNELKE